MRAAHLVVAGALLAGLAPAHATVVCVRKSGAMFLRERCKPKEKTLAVDGVGGPAPKGDPGPAGSPDTPDDVARKLAASTACAGNDPADVMVKVGPLCIDVYEASVWSTRTGGSTASPATTTSARTPARTVEVCSRGASRA